VPMHLHYDELVGKVCIVDVVEDGDDIYRFVQMWPLYKNKNFEQVCAHCSKPIVQAEGPFNEIIWVHADTNRTYCHLEEATPKDGDLHDKKQQKG